MKRTAPGLRAIRTRKGVTQERLETMSGVLQETISRLENRGPGTGVLQAIKLARALGTTVEDLFGEHVEAGGQGAPPRRGRTVVHNSGCERSDAAD